MLTPASAKSLWEEYIQQLSIYIHNIQMCYDSYIIIGGYLGEFSDFFIDDLRKRLTAMDPFHDNADLIIPCTKKDPVAFGSAINYIEEFVNSI